MQGAKTLKAMLLCRRRVHSHKSFSIKTIFEQFIKNHTHGVKNDSNIVKQSTWNHQTTDTDKKENDYPN